MEVDTYSHMKITARDALHPATLIWTLLAYMRGSHMDTEHRARAHMLMDHID